MKTTQQWLSEIKTSEIKFTNWLKRQYVGEALATQRIKSLSEVPSLTNKQSVILRQIADDEGKHTEWIKALLDKRGIPLPEVTLEGTRYWKPILNNLHSFEEVAGAGHHAETMRLHRIEALADDPEMDEDIRITFSNILHDEMFHAKAFKALSTPEAIEKTRTLHNVGLELLGLEV